MQASSPNDPFRVEDLGRKHPRPSAWADRTTPLGSKTKKHFQRRLHNVPHAEADGRQ